MRNNNIYQGIKNFRTIFSSGFGVKRCIIGDFFNNLEVFLIDLKKLRPWSKVIPWNFVEDTRLHNSFPQITTGSVSGWFFCKNKSWNWALFTEKKKNLKGVSDGNTFSEPSKFTKPFRQYFYWIWNIIKWNKRKSLHFSKIDFTAYIFAHWQVCNHCKNTQIVSFFPRFNCKLVTKGKQKYDEKIIINNKTKKGKIN